MPQTLISPRQINGVPLFANLPVILKADNTEATFSNSAAENQYYSVAITGGQLGANDGLEFVFWGSLLNNSGASQSYTFRLKYGGTTILSAASPALQASATTIGYTFRGIVKNAGATNSQKASGAITIATIANTAYGTSAVDSTANQNLVFTIQSGAATATQTLTQLFALLLYHKTT